MTNRREYHRKGRGLRDKGRFVRLLEYMLASEAWQSLDGNCRALYVELSRRYRGPNSNNGKIPYSVREAAGVLHVGRSTAQRCFEKLIEMGFIRVSKRSGFNMKGRVATEWLLTEFPDDTSGVSTMATKDFMNWRQPKASNSPSSDADSPISGPPVVL
jgi:hypothetical protein